MTQEPEILFEDRALVLIHKPAGMVVNRAESVGVGETVQDWADEKLKIQSGLAGSNVNNEAYHTFLARSGVAHRLDKETSGVLVIAKTAEVLARVMAQFRDRTVHKTYTALAHGRLEPGEGGWRLPIGRSPYNRTEFRVDPFGRVSETTYRVDRYYHHETEPLTLVELHPKTGRTHQLRVHLAFMKHPIVSDDKYATPKQIKSDRGWCPRMFLHAHRIEMTHPVSGHMLRIEAPLPPELAGVLQVLGGKS